MNIYLLGNGFDMAHGLKTSYLDFLYFIYNKYVEVEEIVGEIKEEKSKGEFLKDKISSFEINLTEVKENHDRKGISIGINSSYAAEWFLSLSDYMKSDKDFWSSLEESLGSISYDLIIDDDSNYNMEDYYQLDDYLDTLTYEWSCIAKFLNIWLREWIDNEVIISQKVKKFEKFYEEIHSGENYFINFNYTLTLEEKYNINPKNVLHIHGKKGDENLIFGHDGKREKGNSAKNKGNSSEFDKFKKISVLFRDNILDVNNVFKKNLQIDVFEKFIRNLKVETCDNIVINVIGFSFGEVDDLYITKLIEQFPNASWILHKYKNEEKKHIKKLKDNFHIKSQQITTKDILY